MISFSIRQHVTAVFERFLERRQPPTAEVTLSQNRIYILPSRLGWWFGLLVILLYLLGTNYQNNLILITAFMIISLLLAAMLQAFYNLHQLKLRVNKEVTSYAGQDAIVELILQSNSAQMLQLSWFKQKASYLMPQLEGTATAAIPLKGLSRGCHLLPRLKVASLYPFGLFSCWSYPALQAKVWVYPCPLSSRGIAAQGSDQNAATAADRIQPEVNGVKPYQAGDPAARILWKKLAANPNLTVVRHDPAQAELTEQWITVPPLTGAALEFALSEATAKALKLEQANLLYGLRLPHITLVPAGGQAHLTRCLQALALC